MTVPVPRRPTARPRLECPSCGELVPVSVPTEARGGRAVRICRRCQHAVVLTEAILNEY